MDIILKTMDDFYMVIPSNVRNISGEKNKISNFRTYLPKPLTLDKARWRVALVQIDFPFSWNNVSGEVAKIYLKTGDFRATATLKSMYYSEPKDLVKGINYLLEVYDMKSRLAALPGNSCRFTLAPHESVTFHPTLSGILGFNDSVFLGVVHPRTEGDELSDSQYFSDHLMDTRSSFYNMYVYSDLVSETLVGDTYVPLLQTVPIQTTVAGELVHHEYIHPQYMKLQTGSISSIHIQLCDESGNLVRFDKGHVIVKLHFKQYGTN